ncbi:MAG: cysteine dioxygenase [Crocinitomicaceae bacterium]
MSPINTIQELIEAFDNAEPSEQVKVLKSIDIPISDFKEFATWEKGGYTRNCIARRDSFEFILLCWDAGAKTPIHGHDSQNCWVYQVSGSVSEQRFKQTSYGFELTNETVLEQGKITYMHDRMGYHTLENTSQSPSMTLHVYANPIDRCEVYNEQRGCFEVVEMEYDTIEGLEVLKTGS